MNVYLPNLRLPSTYQEVEYIQSSGTQRINTGINVSNDITYGFECKVRFEQISQGSFCIMDMGNTSTDNNRYGISYYYNANTSTGSWQFGYTNPSNPYWGDSVSGYGPNQSTDYTLSYNLNGDKIGKINGTSVLTGMSISNISYANNWNIFCQTYGSTYTRYGTYKLYYMKIYHGNTLVRNFVPCYRKSDSVIGLYDIVNNQFYTNAGTGTFSKGSDVTNELKNAYIGGYVEETYTISSFTASDNTYVREYLSVAKNGYKIKKVKLDGTTKNSSTRGYAAFALNLTDKDYGSSTNPNYAAPGIGLNYGPNNTGNTSWINTGYNGQYTNVFQIPNSVIVFNGTNVLSLESTIDTYTATVNGNTYNGSYSSTNKRDLEYVFTSSTVCFYVRQNSGTASSLVATVTYEPV